MTEMQKIAQAVSVRIDQEIERRRRKVTGKELCWDHGYHEYEEFIDPQSGGFMKCKDCGKCVDCEDPDGDLG